MSDNLKTWPVKVYLQHGEDSEIPHFAGSKTFFGPTWSYEKQFCTDIEYIRKDIHDELVKELESKVSQLETDRDKIIAETIKQCFEIASAEATNARIYSRESMAMKIARKILELLPTNGIKG